MKKVIFIFMLCLSSLIVHSQVISRSELESYVQRGDKSWSVTAKDISKKYQLNSNGELELCIIKEYPGKDKSQLYHQVLNWIISMSSNAQSAVQSCDEKKGLFLQDAIYQTSPDELWETTLIELALDHYLNLISKMANSDSLILCRIMKS